MVLDLSISIASWNVRDLLKKCLESIFKEKRGLNVETIVVDNNSNDGTLAMVKSSFPEVKLIENKSNLGFAAANNQAIKVSKGKYVLLLNPDSIISSNALGKMVEIMESYPKAAALGCKLLLPDGSVQRSCRSFPTPVSMLSSYMPFLNLISKSCREYRMLDFDYNSFREVDQPMGACLMLRMDAIKDVGLLDENFFLYFEEVDWCFRAKAAGWKVYFTPEAQVIHYGKQSSKQFKERHSERYKSMLKYLDKHYKDQHFKLFLIKLLHHFIR